MARLEPLVDNVDSTLEDTFEREIGESEEVRIATGYFYLSGFDLYDDDLDALLDPDELNHAPLRILMGRKTDRRTADEITEGQSLRERIRQEVESDIADLNNAQISRLDRLRDYMPTGSSAESKTE
jgi:hypothetical protein